MHTTVCQLCNKTYANKGNTTNLQFHLDNEHRDLRKMKGIVEKAQTSSSTVTELTVPSKQHSQPRINSMMVNFTGRLPKSKQDGITNQLLKLIVGKALPLSLVKSKYFLEYTELLDPRYKVPGSNELTKLLNKKKDEMQQRLQKDLKAVSDVALTHDSWTSIATQSFDAVTVHFIDKDWNLKSAVLQTKKFEGSHTAENISDRLREAQADWQLPIPVLVTDNAANEKKAAEITGWNRFGCYGHRINLIVKHSLDIPELSRILGKSRKLVTFLHQSTSVTDMFIEKQGMIFSNTPELIGHKLIMDVPTRWNSTLAMLSRLAEQTPVIMALANETNLSKHAVTTIRNTCLTFEEHSIVQQLIEILKPFEKATTILCGQKTPTMNKVLPSVTLIKRALEAVAPSASPVVRKVIEKMQVELGNRTMVEDLPAIAAVLSPDTKHVSFLDMNEQEHVRKLLLEQALRISDTAKVKEEKKDEAVVTDENSDSPSLPSLDIDKGQELVQSTQVNKSRSLVKRSASLEIPESPPKKFKCSDFEEWFEDICCTGVSKQPVESVIEQEIHRYFSSSRSNQEASLSLLEWWKKNEMMYPRLAILAKKYLAVPASSVPSERVFSLSGTIVSKKRSRLHPDMVDTLVFLSSNMEQYWDKKP